MLEIKTQWVQLILSWFKFQVKNHSVLEFVELKLVRWVEID